MTSPEMRYARLDRERLEKLRKLEENLGKVVVAYEPQVTPAELNDEQIKQVQALEDELGVVLVAYDEA